MSRNQNIAADPKASVFLTANAGSGKTSTLVNRVARLLLGGAKPEHILCVTYTKAAAAEMQGRLFATLGAWAVTTDEKLTAELEKIAAPAHDLPRARALFARALETPGGLKIQTIHAFCERLLRRFPLEADLSPAFQVQDDLLGSELAEKAKASLLLLSGFEEIAAARDRLIRRLKISGFEGLLGQFISAHDKIRTAIEALLAHDDWPERLFGSLGLPNVCTRRDCLDAYARRLEWRIVRDIADVLSLGGSKTNQDAGRAFFDLHLHYEAHGVFALDLVQHVFLTKDGGRRKSIYTKETKPADARWLDDMADEIIALVEQVKAADIAADTLDAIRLFRAFSEIYRRLKLDEGALDFQDLINRARDLLSDDLKAAWVLFKLDGGLEHILVDEAQDTSEDQWAIVRALSGEFFSGHGQLPRPRTVFAVGDEKQSIYGFQGAQPDRFIAEGRYFAVKADEAGADFVSPDLTESWRSLPETLGFVDKVFDAPDLAEALNFTGDVVRHEARRGDAKGCVELWPLTMAIAAPETDAEDGDDIAPVDQASRHHPAKRLAKQIAATIAADIAAGRSVHDKAQKRWRPMHAGDVLVLVRKRDHLFEHIIRELKMAGVAVSGADRLRLGDHIAFQDLRALMRFCLQPADDLSLACVLRSPMCDIDETALFDLAQPRERSLWRAVRDRPETDDGRAFLLWARRAAHDLTAFDFLGRVLTRRDATGRSFRQRFLTRLGNECEDVLDETLALALKAEGTGAAGLAACLDLFEFNASEIKREQEEGGGSVRVMTVHGSKGLEAPWVILPVAPNYGGRKDSEPLLLPENGQPYLCAGGKKADVQAITALRDARTRKDDQESLRLFYVALTRARDRLTVCGYLGKTAPRTGTFPSWYELAAEAFAALPVTEEVMPLAAPFDDLEQNEQAVVKIYGERSPLLTAEARIRPADIVLPAFAVDRVAQADVDYERWQAISQMGDEDRGETERAPSPLERRSGLDRYRRGNLIHKLFEILPDIAADRRIDVAGRYLARQGDLDAGQRDEMRDAVMAVLDDARFAEAFGPGSRPEIALAGQIGVDPRGEALLLSGRIDRLVVTDDRVLIIDYKSNRPAPDRAEDAAVAYQRQMAGYVALLRQIHPGKAVEAAPLWTDGPRLTPLSDALVNLRLGEIQARLGRV